MRSEQEITDLIQALQYYGEEKVKKMEADEVEQRVLQLFKIKGATEYLKWVLGDELPNEGFFALMNYNKDKKKQ